MSIVPFRRPIDHIETARGHVWNRLTGCVSQTVMAQAQARVERLVAHGVEPNRAVAQVCAWALSVDHPPEAA